MNYRETAKKVKEASIILGALPEADRNRALQAIGFRRQPAGSGKRSGSAGADPGQAEI